MDIIEIITELSPDYQANQYRAIHLSSSEIMTWVYLALQSIALVLFLIFMGRYSQVFGKKKDPLSVACVVLVILTLAIKIVFKAIVNLGVYVVYDLSFSDFANHDPPLDDPHFPRRLFVCLNNMSNMLPQFCFTTALLLNSMRWLLLTLLYKNVIPL